MQEASETQTWLDFCLACEYIEKDTFERLDAEYEKILGKLNSMEMKADKFCPPSKVKNVGTYEGRKV